MHPTGKAIGKQVHFEDKLIGTNSVEVDLTICIKIENVYKFTLAIPLLRIILLCELIHAYGHSL